MRRIIITILLLLLIFPVFSQSDIASYTEWVGIKPRRTDMSGKWDIIEYPEDPLMVTITQDSFFDPANIKKVLILFPKKSSAYDTALDKILQLFEEKEISAEFTIINFMGQTIPGLEALTYARSNNMDLIFSMGSTSTKFIVEQYSGINNIPVVSVCSKDPVLLGLKVDGNYETGSGTNIAFTSLDVSAELHINYLLDLNPNLENIAIMYRIGNSSAVTTQVRPLEEIAEELGINIIHVVVQNKETAREELEVLIPQAVEEIKRLDPNVSKSIFWITGSTSVFNEIETINMYSENVPVLSIPKDVVQERENSAVLSIGVGFESNAHLAALYGIGILTGEYTAGELPVGVITPPDIAINFLKARQIGLRIPFKFFESANFIYDYEGNLARGND